jgi:tRNA U34 5-carboxymethylaminomethyl modifying GTPase MnmE/TrmE
MDIEKTETGEATVYAPATAAGRAGIGVVRVSGPKARSALAALVGKVPEPRHAGSSWSFRDRAATRAKTSPSSMFTEAARSLPL